MIKYAELYRILEQEDAFQIKCKYGTEEYEKHYGKWFETTFLKPYETLGDEMACDNLELSISLYEQVTTFKEEVTVGIDDMEKFAEHERMIHYDWMHRDD